MIQCREEMARFNNVSPWSVIWMTKSVAPPATTFISFSAPGKTQINGCCTSGNGTATPNLLLSPGRPRVCDQAQVNVARYRRPRLRGLADLTPRTATGRGVRSHSSHCWDEPPP